MLMHCGLNNFQDTELLKYQLHSCTWVAGNIKHKVNTKHKVISNFSI